MRIGILTFHWATNYGAILQAYCLQEYLIKCGNNVNIINYKPQQYEFSFLRILQHPSLWKSVKRILASERKEKLLIPFREQHLKMTRLYRSVTEFGKEIDQYDVLISGSDQVLNPGFTMHGDNGNPSPVYWLGLGSKDIKRLGYAVSFGRDQFPDCAIAAAKKWVNGFDAIGLREQTGIHILEQLGYLGKKEVLPDPTFLLGKELFQKLSIEVPTKKSKYTCVYMLRHEIQIGGNVRYIDDKHHPLTMEQWLNTIANASQLVTNSYHGMIMAMFSHVPFAVLLETGSGIGMNNRFQTLLRQLGIENRMVTTLEEAFQVLQIPIDFDKLDYSIEKYRKTGVLFLSKNIN